MNGTVLNYMVKLVGKTIWLCLAIICIITVA